MTGPAIRPARPDDAAAIADIYNHYVRSSTATFETQERDAEHRRAWLAEHGERYPVIVAEIDDGVIGWASLSKWAERPGWRYAVEVSVYVANDSTGAGVGPLLLERIVEAGKYAGFHALLAQIVGDNQPSLKMAKRAGFVEVGRLVEAGNKFDRWLDVVLVERVLT